MKIFGEQAKEAASKEMDQLHRRNCFSPIAPTMMTDSEKGKTVEGIMFVTKKRDDTIKARYVMNGKPTRAWDTEDSASPTAMLESIMLTAIVDAHEQRDVMTADVPNAFIQADMPTPKDGEDRTIIKIAGVLAELLETQAPEVYSVYCVHEREKNPLRPSN